MLDTNFNATQPQVAYAQSARVEHLKKMINFSEEDNIVSQDIDTMVKNAKAHIFNRDYAKAAPLLKCAVLLDNDAAKNNLGFLFQNGYGVPKDPRVTAELFQMASIQGHQAARQNLSDMYHAGEAVAIDQAKSAQYQRNYINA